MRNTLSIGTLAIGTLAIALGLLLAANGLLMLADPATWYALVPGVPETGPFNPHFVRDIGAAYLVTGAAIAALALDARAMPAALAGALFLTLHALVHVADAIAGRLHAEHLAADLVTVFVPAVIALWLVYLSTPISRRTPMLNWLMKRRLNAFERDYSYDASYMHDMLAVDAKSVLALFKVQAMAHYRKDVPREPWYAAALVGSLAEDCGPCTQLGITMAEREGVAPDTLRAIVAGDLRAMPDDVVLAYRFAKASLAHDPAADELRDEIVKRWGQRGLISLAFALAATRVFPTVKYALGHGKTCSRVTVAGKPLPVLKEAA
jgi:uncharacterized protein YjeT (DUF2065 family)